MIILLIDTMRTERQHHGFEYEDRVISKYKLIKTIGYANKFDAYKDNIPVQIKCIKNKSSIEMASYIRNKNINENFILIVGFWEKYKDNIVQEHVLYIDISIYSTFFKYDYYPQMMTEFKLISNLIVDDDNWKKFRLKYSKLWPKNNIVSLRFKRDHKNQKRIQCSINYTNFISKFIKLFSYYIFD
jgi:hypothetical protein